MDNRDTSFAGQQRTKNVPTSMVLSRAEEQN